MNALTRWIDARIGLFSAWNRGLNREFPGGPSWRYVLPGLLGFAFLIEAITGLVLWMSYSPGAQTAWESIFWFQETVRLGWLVRGIHFYAGHGMVLLAGLYLVQLIFTGMYRAPREFVFWLAVAVFMVLLGLMLTGDLLRWDQEGYWSTQVRTRFLQLLPGVGAGAFKVAVGGSDFGHLTLTRFTALHAGVLAVALALLLVWHGRVMRCAGLAVGAARRTAACCYWPGQALRNALAAVIFLAAVGLLSGQNVFRGGHEGQLRGQYLGAPLGAPADPAEAYAAARPEWAFLPLYQFANIFPGDPIGHSGLSWKVVPIFVIPTALVLLLLLMPVIGRIFVGHLFNVALLVALAAGAVGLAFAAIEHDRNNPSHQAAKAAGEEEAQRVKELARGPEGIPVTGALTLLRNDPRTQGPRLFRQHCASCHNHLDADGRGIVAEKPSAPNLYHFARRGWLAGLLDPQRIVGPDYFGNTALRGGEMVGFVKENFGKLEADERKELESAVAALSAEAGLKSQQDQDAHDATRIAEGKKLLLGTYGCTDCHHYAGKGQMPKGPDLNGYGSRDWLTRIISNPADSRCYGKRNDRMPAYGESAGDPSKNILSPREIGMLADWLRGEWYEGK